MSGEKLFTVTELAEAYDDGWNGRHDARYQSVDGDNPRSNWSKSKTLTKAQAAAELERIRQEQLKQSQAADPNRDINQIEAMAQVLRECRWFKYPEGTGEDKPVVWAEMLYDAAVHARQPSRIDQLSPVYEVKPVFRKIELTIHANMPPPVMLAAALAQALDHFDKDVTIAQAESAFELARKTLHEPDDHR